MKDEQIFMDSAAESDYPDITGLVHTAILLTTETAPPAPGSQLLWLGPVYTTSVLCMVRNLGVMLQILSGFEEWS